ncbi:MAG: DUF3168 domain-containing protein [Parasphingorhabdus sp.]|uniref:DUF3168 domain-containing protein n=1 Tax=Parasphingorhabdus sp. TaxID=2709688 RepID=UPI0032997070
MTGAIEAVQRSLVAALQAHPPLVTAIDAIYDGPPPRAHFPYIALATGSAADWSLKDRSGRRLSLALTVHDNGNSAARMHHVMGLIEQALDSGLNDPEDWQIVTFIFRRSRIVRDAISPWTGLIEYRADVLQDFVI